jgi:DNA-binding winged helix-turn-helix (wHTH) protein
VNSVFCFDDFELDCGAFTLRRFGEHVRIDVLVLRVLQVLVRNAGELTSKEQLIAEVWNGRAVTDNALTVAVARLRKVFRELGMPRESILTSHGHGYRFTRRVSTHRRDAESASVVELYSPEFVGRKHVMLQLQAALADAQNGRGRLVALCGDAGIGKTRVAEVFAQYAERAGCAVSWGCGREPERTPPLWPFVELLRDMTSTQSSAGMRVPHKLLSFLTEIAAQAGSIQPDLDSVEKLRELGSEYRLFDAIACLLVSNAEDTTRVLILDDLACVDETSLALLRYLLPDLSRMRVLVVATLPGVHADCLADPSLMAALLHRNCLRIAIEPLNQDDVTSYLGARFNTVSRALCRRVYEISEGNPSCMVEVAAQLQTGSVLDAAELTVPEIAVELARKRLAGLDADARDVLTYAAVLGRVFGLPLLAAVMGRDAIGLMATIDRASAANFVRTVAGSNTEFRFVHGAVCDALYEGQSASERRARHLRVMQTLEQRRALAEASLTELAHHARCALPEGDLRKTVDYCSRAASAAEQAGAFAEAIRYLQDAREALGLIDSASPEERYRLLFRHALLLRAHSSREFVALAEQLVRSAWEQGGAAMAAASLLLDPLPGFPPLLIKGCALADALAALPHDVPSLRPALLARLASSVPLAYAAAGCYAEIESALTLASRSPECADRLSAHFGELYLYGGPEHKGRAESSLSTLLRLCSEAQLGPLPLSLLDLHCTLTALQHGDVAAATRALDRWELRCHELHGEMLWHLQRLRALIQINLGFVRDGRHALRELHRRTRCCDGSVGAGLFCVYDQHLPLPPFENFSVEQVVVAPDAHDPPSIWALKVRMLELDGSLAEARNALELVPADRLRELPCDRDFLGTMGALARTAVRLQAHPYARIIYERLAPFPECFAVNLSGFCEGSVSLLLGLLARSLGDTERAEEHFELANVLSSRAGFERSASEARSERAQCAQGT